MRLFKLQPWFFCNVWREKTACLTAPTQNPVGRGGATSDLSNGVFVFFFFINIVNISFENKGQHYFDCPKLLGVFLFPGHHPNGHYLSRAPSRTGTIPMGTILCGHHPEWAPSRMGNILCGHNHEWAPSQCQ